LSLIYLCLLRFSPNIGGSQPRLPRERELQEQFGCQSGVPNEAKQAMGQASVLMDAKRYPAHEFSRLYHLRWGVEEFHKRLKHHQEIDNISGKSAQVVLQDFHAKIKTANLTAALVVSGHRYLGKISPRSNISSKSQ
jgi:hypothetical protein